MKYALPALLATAALLLAGDKVSWDFGTSTASKQHAKDTSSLWDFDTPVKPDPHVVPFLTSYTEAGELAAKENRPLMVWIAYKCPSSANQLPGAVHVFLDRFQGDTTQRVVVGVPDGKGWLNLAGTVKAEDCCASTLTRVAEGGPKRVEMQTHQHTPTIQGGSWGGGMMGQPMRTAPTRFQLRGGGGGACST